MELLKFLVFVLIVLFWVFAIPIFKLYNEIVLNDIKLIKDYIEKNKSEFEENDSEILCGGIIFVLSALVGSIGAITGNHYLWTGSLSAVIGFVLFTAIKKQRVGGHRYLFIKQIQPI